MLLSFSYSYYLMETIKRMLEEWFYKRQVAKIMDLSYPTIDKIAKGKGKTLLYSTRLLINANVKDFIEKLEKVHYQDILDTNK